MLKLFPQIIWHYLNYRAKSLEAILRRSLLLLDAPTIDEIKLRTESYTTPDGGYANKAGKSDLYYTLFGVLVEEALYGSFNSTRTGSYVERTLTAKEPQGVELHCAAILLSKLKKIRSWPQLAERVKHDTLNIPDTSSYNYYLSLLSLYYVKDLRGIMKLLQRPKTDHLQDQTPCPVVAAQAIAAKLSGAKANGIEGALMTHYTGDGSFKALKESPTGDLLSTSVALYALNFGGYDLRAIKPDCLSYIDSLYEAGSFRATGLDFDTDVEYTFYGLLALGALA